MKCAFVFEFFNEDNDTMKFGVIEINPEAYTYAKEELLHDTISQIEDKYGVHDFTGEGEFGKHNYRFGFTTYEILGDNIKKCLGEWRQKLEEVFGKENVKPLVMYTSQAKFDKWWDA